MMKTSGHRALEQIFKCVKPLLFKNTEPEFLLSIKGTCFLFHLDGRYYGLTANHCLNNFSHESVRIRLVPGQLEFLRIGRVLLPKNNEHDWMDFTVFELRDDGLPRTVEEGHFMSMNGTDAEVLSPQDILYVPGCPEEDNNADYESSILFTKVVASNGHYAGPAEAFGCSKIQFVDLGPINSLNEFSGAPVIAFRRTGPKNYKQWFAGVLIQASAESKRGHFIDADVIVRTLRTTRE